MLSAGTKPGSSSSTAAIPRIRLSTRSYSPMRASVCTIASVYWADHYHLAMRVIGRATERCPRCTGSFHKLHTGAHLLDRFERLMCSYAVLDEKPSYERRLALLREVLIVPESDLDHGGSYG